MHGSLVPSHGVSKEFVQVMESGATAVAAGTGFSMVLKEDDSVWAMGRNTKGQLGDGAMTSTNSFSLVQMIPLAIFHIMLVLNGNRCQHAVEG